MSYPNPTGVCYYAALCVGGPLDGQQFPIKYVGKTLMWPEADQHSGTYRLAARLGDGGLRYEWEEATNA